MMKKVNGKITLEKLATMVAGNFGHLEEKMDKKFLQVDRRFDQVDGKLKIIDIRLDEIDQKLEGVDQNIYDLHNQDEVSSTTMRRLQKVIDNFKSPRKSATK